MRRTHPLDSRIPAAPRFAALLFAALGAIGTTAARAAAQIVDDRPLVVDQYVSRARLHPAVAGDRARLDGVGFRVTQPLAAPDSRRPAWVAFGGYVAYAQSREPGLTALQYGVLADVPLRAAPLPGRLVPLASLGLGAFRAQHTPSARLDRSPACVAPADLLRVRRAPVPCGGGVPSERLGASTDLAVSPAVGARLGLWRSISLRADVRDVIVYHGGPRHNRELSTGLSFVL